MDNYDVKCPFCGKSIVGQPLYKLPFEETVKRDYNIGRTWAGSYLQETKHKIRFNVRCCKECYEEDEKAENIMMKYIMFAAPTGILAGIGWHLYLVFEKGKDFSFIAMIICAVIGMFLFTSPNMFVNLMFKKRTSYKHAEKCNALV